MRLPATAVAGLATVELGVADAPRLQRFFDENPACFHAVQGEPAGAELEAWARASGADWLRLGVVEGNLRAERFWASRGFVPLRTRGGYRTGSRTNVICTMVKPLNGGSLARCLELVERDRPDPAA